MTRKWYKKMLLSGILCLVIFIRHTVLCTYADDDYKPRWSIGINQNQQFIHQQHSRTAQQAISFPAPSSPHQHRHHHADNMHKNNREMHIKSQHSHFYLDRDYRPATKATTKTPTTLSWKWSSATTMATTTTTTTTPANFKLPELTHINSYNYQGGNETNDDGTMEMNPLKNRLANSERHPQWNNKNNKRISIWPYHIKVHNDDTPTSTIKTDHNYGSSSWSHHKSNSHQEQLLSDERKTSRIDYFGKISHEDQGFKSKADYDEDYDENDYYEEVDEIENKLGGRMEDEQLSEYRVEEKIIHNHENEDEDEADKKVKDKNRRQEVEDDYSSEFLKDDPLTSNDDQNQTMSLTEMKWKNLGTAAAVARTRQQYLNSPQSKVDAHIQKLKEEGKCRWPHPKVIPLIDASNRFIPHCTILHRCADDTGCCDDDKKTCVAKKSTSVDLYFYIIPIHNHSKPSIEVRKFDNHTECHCVDKSRHRRTPRHNSHIDADQSCRCPNNFHVVRERGLCHCDCFTWNQDCYDLKEGKYRFPFEDMNCILENKCQKPACEHGHYNRQTGRCPKSRTTPPRTTYR